MTPATLHRDVEQLGPWFHNLRLGHDHSLQTAPRHPLGDFPSNFWQLFSHVVPAGLSGRSVLDVGCNAGFYSFEMKRRGARRVVGIDSDPFYLRQASFAQAQLGFTDVEFRELDVYDAGQIQERFDLVLFLGVFYHLRHPLWALEQVVKRVAPGGLLLFQTMERGAQELMDVAPDYDFDENGVFFDERFPRMYFIEQRFAGDPTNWWIPNAAATGAILRSVGLIIADHPCREVYLCKLNQSPVDPPPPR